MSKNKDKEILWEFSFRNFDPHHQMFSVNHADCGGEPYIDGRGRCWHKTIDTDLRGDLGYPTYSPRKYLLKLDEMGDIISGSLQAGADALIAIFSGEFDFINATVDVLDLTNSIQEFKGYDALEAIDDLDNKANAAFESVCNSINRTSAEVVAIAEKMGLKNFGFLAGDSYQKMIHDNSQVMNNHGWTVLRTKVEDHSEKYKANAAFVYQGKLIYYWNSYDCDGFWTKK